MKQPSEDEFGLFTTSNARKECNSYDTLAHVKYLEKNLSKNLDHRKETFICMSERWRLIEFLQFFFDGPD